MFIDLWPTFGTRSSAGSIACWILKHILFLHLFSNYKQLLVPFLSEALNKRFLKEFIGSDSFAAAFDESTAADIPLMKVYTNEIADLAQTYRIQVTRNRFTPCGTPFTVCLVYKTYAVSVLVTRCEHAVFVVYNGCDKVSVTVVIHHSLLLDNGTRLGSHLVFHHLISLLKLVHLIKKHRRTCIALHAASPLAMSEVTTKIFLKKVE